jgi:hypothetical protein
MRPSAEVNKHVRENEGKPQNEWKLFQVCPRIHSEELSFFIRNDSLGNTGVEVD